MRLPDRLLAQSGFHLRGIPIRGYAVILQDSTSMFRARPPEKVIIEFTDPNQRESKRHRDSNAHWRSLNTSIIRRETRSLIKFWLMYGSVHFDDEIEPVEKLVHKVFIDEMQKNQQSRKSLVRWMDEIDH